jgi:hypothetical protein
MRLVGVKSSDNETEGLRVSLMLILLVAGVAALSGTMFIPTFITDCTSFESQSWNSCPRANRRKGRVT